MQAKQSNITSNESAERLTKNMLKRKLTRIRRDIICSDKGIERWNDFIRKNSVLCEVYKAASILPSALLGSTAYGLSSYLGYGRYASCTAGAITCGLSMIFLTPLVADAITSLIEYNIIRKTELLSYYRLCAQHVLDQAMADGYMYNDKKLIRYALRKGADPKLRI